MSYLIQCHVHFIHQEHIQLTQKCLQLILICEGFSSQHFLTYYTHYRVLTNTRTQTQRDTETKTNYHYRHVCGHFEKTFSHTKHLNE